MEVSFQQVVFFGFILLVLLNAFCYRKNGRIPSSLIALTAYFVITMLFFAKALIYDFCLLPGDLITWNYPWKFTAVPDVLPHNSLLWDSVSACFPWICSLKSAMENGSLPLWNFHSYSGSPLGQNFVSAQFNPLNIFLFFMKAVDFSTLMPFLRVIFSGTGTFIFLRLIKFSLVPSFFGGLLFAFSGVNIVWLSNYPNITVIMFLPWLLICMERIASGKGVGWFFLLVFCSVFQFLGGHPESSFHMYLFVAAYFFYQLYLQCIQGKSGATAVDLCKRISMVVAAGLLSLGFVAFQLMPFLDYLPLTTRYFEIIEKGNNIFGSFECVELLKLITGTIINPDFFGNPVDNNYWGFANYNEQNTYFTVAGLFLSCLGMVKSSSIKFGKWFFIGAALFSFAMVVRVPFFYEFVKSLPGFAMAANYRLIFVVVFCLVILAVSGLEELSVNRSVTLFHVVLVALLLISFALILHFFTLFEIKTEYLNYRIEKLIFFFLFLGILTMLSAATLHFKKFASIFSFIAVFIVLIDCWHHGADYNTFMKKQDVFPETPLIKFISSQLGKYRVVGWNGALFPGAEQVYGYDSITGYDAMKIYAYENILTRINGSYNPVFTSEIESLESKWLNFLNVKYVAAPPDNNDEVFLSDRFELVYDGDDGNVYENKNCFPRVFFAKNIVVAETRQRAFEIIDGKDFSPEKSIVVESITAKVNRIEPDVINSNKVEADGIKVNHVVSNTSLMNKDCGMVLEIKKYGGNEIIVTNTPLNTNTDTDTDTDHTDTDHNLNTGICTDNNMNHNPDNENKLNPDTDADNNLNAGNGSGLIVLSEVWFPGWKVFVDGKQRELLRINTSFMGVVVSSGEKNIKFVFKPDSFQTGVFISFISLIITIIAGKYSASTPSLSILACSHSIHARSPK